VEADVYVWRNAHLVVHARKEEEEEEEEAEEAEEEEEEEEEVRYVDNMSLCAVLGEDGILHRVTNTTLLHV